MKIDFVRSGGFAGLRLAVSLDTESLPSEDAFRIAQLIEGARFFELDEAASAPPEPDRFEYRLTIESENWGRRAVVLSESSVPDALCPLIDVLTALAQRHEGPDQTPPQGSPSTT